ncbi:hypothetical protein [Cryptosporangium sp. NPDC051539]|uniref:hypothetical protein n=1 Tax=Cryptosporangium sp. NPDC051539 TaxID=3363962 RepID=UPI00378CB482
MTGVLDGRVAIVTGVGRRPRREHPLEPARQDATVIVTGPGTSGAGEATRPRPPGRGPRRSARPRATP